HDGFGGDLEGLAAPNAQFDDAVFKRTAQNRAVWHAEQLGILELNARRNLRAVIEKHFDACLIQSFYQLVAGLGGIFVLVGYRHVYLVRRDIERPVQALFVMALFCQHRHHARDTNAIRAHGGDGTLAVFVQNLHIKGTGVFPAQLEDVTKLHTALKRQGALTFWSGVAFVDLGGFHEFIDLEIAACYQTNDVAVFRICTSDPRGTRDHARIGVDLNAIGIEPTWA